MNKTMKEMLESKVSIFRRGNHGVHVWKEAHESHIVDDWTGAVVSFMATREFFYLGSVICVANDKNKTFRLSHAGVYAHVYEHRDGVRIDTGVIKEGVFPKTTTQRLMSYRDYFVTAGYEEVEPIDGRPARNWMEWDKAREEGRPMKAYQPRKRAKQPKIKGISREMEELLKSKGIDVMGIVKEAEFDKELDKIKSQQEENAMRETAVLFEQAEFDKLMERQQLEEQTRWEIEGFYKEKKDKETKVKENKKNLFQKQPYSRSHKPVAKCRSMIVVKAA